MTLGWDSRWGQLRKVTAEGSSSTGTYRPYGLDCSGFVDWVFYNATDGAYVIGHGGAHMQHSYCTEISLKCAYSPFAFMYILLLPVATPDFFHCIIRKFPTCSYRYKKNHNT